MTKIQQPAPNNPHLTAQHFSLGHRETGTMSLKSCVKQELHMEVCSAGFFLLRKERLLDGIMLLLWISRAWRLILELIPNNC